MSKTRREKKRESAKKKRAELPPIDPLTVAWMTTMATALGCEIGALAARLYVRFVDRRAELLQMLSTYLILAAAIVGLVLIVMTPIIVRRKRSNPPKGIVAFAFFVGAAPWAVMIFRALE